jgi:hypothetical protein
MALRVYLDEMYESIISSSDIPKSKNAKITKLEVALNSIEKTLNESGIRKTITSLRGFIGGEFVNIAGIGLGVTSIAPSLDISPLTAGLTGATITFAVRKIISPNIRGVHPLTYVSSIKRDLY